MSKLKRTDYCNADARRNDAKYQKLRKVRIIAQQVVLNVRHFAITLSMTASHVSHHCPATLCPVCDDDHRFQHKISSGNKLTVCD